MAKKDTKQKKYTFSDRRYFASCSKCTAYFEAKKLEDMQKRCSCGELLTWNDSYKLKTLEGVR